MALLEITDLVVRFRTHDGTVYAVNGVSFDLDEGETLGIVGESGSGKSVTNLAVMRLLPRPAGHIEGGRALFEGQDLTTLSESEMRELRGKDIAMIFQDPMTSLNPVLTIGEQMIETIRAHRPVKEREARDRAIELLGEVGIPQPETRMSSFPHHFSGGMRQRVMIAMALALEPKLLIADEPTTSLDVTIQAQVLELLRRLTNERQTALILITHDLGVVAGMTQRVNVMYGGYIVEAAPTTELFARPRHPYTVGLLHSIPRLDALEGEPLIPIEGTPPDLRRPPTGCPFAPRCGWRVERCWSEMPPLAVVLDVDAPLTHQPRMAHATACWNPPLQAEAEAGRPLRPGFVAAPPPQRPSEPGFRETAPAQSEGIVEFDTDFDSLTMLPGAHGLPEPPDPDHVGARAQRDPEREG
jgi:oligopeptide transport system ATP-binding protein